jgi:hypothetical protein
VPAGPELGKNALLEPILMRSRVAYNTTPLAWQKKYTNVSNLVPGHNNVDMMI